MKIGRVIGIQTLTISVMFMLLVATVSFYWFRLDSAQARIRDDAITLRDYRLLSEVVSGWVLSGDLVFGRGQVEMVAAGLRQGEQIANLAAELSRDLLASPYQDSFADIATVVADNQAVFQRAQQVGPGRIQDMFPIWDASSQQVISQAVGLGELLIRDSDANSVLAAEERRMFLALIAVECGVFALLIFVLWHWTTGLISRPLRQLTGSARRALTLGAEMERVSSSVDEIGSLSASINDFTRTLSERVEDRTQLLEQQSRSLAEEVDLRRVAQKAAQEAADKAAAANKAKGQFLANMSHEFRTPLNAIIGGAQLLELMKLEQSARDWAQTIGDSGNHLLALVDDVLDFSKLDEDEFDLVSEEFTSESLWQRCHSLFAAHSGDSELDFTLEVDPLIPEQLVGDCGRIQQILTNLIGNAVKFTEAGTVSVNVSVLRHDAETIKLNWRITDTGIGIAEQDYDRIFEFFEQVDNSHSREYGGNGLGLAISRELARKMGGDISVESEPGVGSTFYCSMTLGLCEEIKSQEAAHEDSSESAQLA